MSTGLECFFAEVTPGEWFYVLEHGSAPKNAWDWKEYATAYGPFASFEDARDHLQRHHANPGGWSSYEYEPNAEWSETEQRLFADARELSLRSSGRYRIGY